MEFSDKMAVITGSNSGIGLAVARYFAARGADIVINSFTDNESDHALAHDIGSEFGVDARYISADLRKGAEARNLILAAGRCDILVNNAGMQHIALVDEFPLEKWDDIIALNLNAAFHTTATALPMMRAAGWGRVVNIASAHGLTASPAKSAYVAAKHGIVGLSKTVALETAEEAITCNAVCPGYVRTPMVEKQIPELMDEFSMSYDDVVRDVMLARQPSKQFVTVEQLAGTIGYLCSDAAAQVTGTTISVDGGWTAL